MRHLTRAIDGACSGPAERGEFDFVADFAGKFPMDVISELMGVPEGDRDRLRHLADTVMHRDDDVFDVPQAAMTALPSRPASGSGTSSTSATSLTCSWR